VQESVECLVSQENHPGLAESTIDVDLAVAVVEDLDGGGKVVRDSRLSPHYRRLYWVGAWEKHPNWAAADRERYISFNSAVTRHADFF